jgi:hypothetical protein
MFTEIFGQIQVTPAETLSLFLSAWLHKWNVQPWKVAERGRRLLQLILGRIEEQSLASEAIEHAVFQRLVQICRFYKML